MHYNVMSVNAGRTIVKVLSQIPAGYGICSAPNAGITVFDGNVRGWG